MRAYRLCRTLDKKIATCLKHVASLCVYPRERVLRVPLDKHYQSRQQSFDRAMRKLGAKPRCRQ